MAFSRNFIKYLVPMVLIAVQSLLIHGQGDIQYVFNNAKTKCAKLEPASPTNLRPTGGSNIETQPPSVNTKEKCAKACVEYPGDKCKLSVIKEIEPKQCILYHFSIDDAAANSIPPAPGQKFTIATVIPFTDCPVSSTTTTTTTTEATTTPTTTTTTTTAPAITIDPACQDTNTQCKKWAKDGQCDANPFFIRVECPRACTRCPGFQTRTIVNACGDTYDPARPDCPNNHEKCNFWASIGDCTRNAVWMKPNCCAACEKLNSVILKNCPLSPNAPYKGEG